MWWIYLLPIAGLILAVIIKACVTTPSQALNNKFVEMGVLAGKSYDEIVAVVGPPNSTAQISDDTILCQWIQTAYHIALLFDTNMVCLGVSSEIKVDE